MLNSSLLRRLSGFALGVLLFGSAMAAGTAPVGPWTKLFAFGDSYTDSGAGYVDGDGPTAIVYAARELGLPFTHAADPAIGAQGINFAVSGARTGEGAGRREKGALLGYGMLNQADDFARLVREGKVRFAPATTLFFIAGGLNDSRLETATTVANLTALVRRLHDAGARHFLLARLPEKIPAFAAVGARLNPALTALPAQLAREFPDARFTLSRWGDYFDALLANPARYGFTNTTEPCAGRALRDEDPTPRGDPARYFYYHAGHPSTAAQRWVAVELCREILAAAP